MTSLMTLNQHKTYVIIASLKSKTMGKLRHRIPGWCLLISSLPGFIADTMISYLNSRLDLNLSCTKEFLNLNSMVTWYINRRRLLALIFFQLST